MTRKGTICLLCGESKAASNFMKHRNDKLADGLGFCKACVNEYDVTDSDSITDLFRMMNIPFIQETWESLKVDGDDGLLGKYLRAIATRREYKSYKDSVYGNTQETMSGTKSTAEVTPEMIERWGVGKSSEDYMALEKAYESLTKIKIPSTHQEEKRYVLNVKLSQALDQVLEGGEVKQIKPIREAYTKDLKELGLDVDSSDDEMKSLGQRIQEWERNEPVPLMDEEFSDVDNIKKYFNKYFTIPMKRVFGQATDEEVALLHEVEGDDADGYK
ncbi:hypothetical protein [Enterococcus mundtii]|uniref:hypothetical protein n=1 Tax=Enterococcus mundtii TaxID=53346 RepID=UPI001A956A5F|nr:hypothetical protein [Enterococcus mundtii]MBO1087257.1 hypothetical protein [Enterococcus mundtii]